MGVELGAKAAMVPPDETTVRYVEERTDKPFDPLLPDKDATYAQVIEVDVGTLEPLIACPHDVGNVKPVSEAEGKTIHQATVGTCTNGGYDDLEVLAGRKVHPGVRFYVTPNTAETYLRAMESGILKTLMEAEAVVVNAQCGSCSGHIGVLSAGEVCIAAQNRNFKGRMGSPDSEIFLASPATAAASAIEGKITNPKKYL